MSDSILMPPAMLARIAMTGKTIADIKFEPGGTVVILFREGGTARFHTDLMGYIDMDLNSVPVVHEESITASAKVHLAGENAGDGLMGYELGLKGRIAAPDNETAEQVRKRIEAALVNCLQAHGVQTDVKVWSAIVITPTIPEEQP